MSTKKGPLPVRNQVVFVWKDDAGKVQAYKKLLKPPKGLWARQTMPKIMGFAKVLADIQKEVSALAEGDMSGQLAMVEKFFTPENEELFPVILQLEGEKELRIYNEELNPVAVLTAVSDAVGFFISESFDRPDVQEALKKSDGEEENETQS